MGEPKTEEYATELGRKMVDYEQIIARITPLVEQHYRLGRYEMCGCGWRNPDHTYAEHLAAIIATRIVSRNA